MTTIVARIQEVLQGHSDRAQIRAVNAQGHELRFEVPVETARGLTAEHVLVLDWSAHLVPDRPTANAPDTPDTPATSVTSSEPTTGPSPGARQLATLMGLKLE